MKVRYTYNGNVYLFTNFASSNNPLFTDSEEVENFRNRLEKHLKELCEILAFCVHVDHYQMVVVLKEREAFEAFYRNKVDLPGLGSEQIPESTYIFSQEMANIQSGYAKWFNYRHRRFGAVFGRRYTKVLIENEETLKEWISAINNRVRFWEFEDLWSYVYNFVRRHKGNKVNFSRAVHSGNRNIFRPFINSLSLVNFLLRGQYKPYLPPP